MRIIARLQATALIYKLSNDVDAYGNPRSWVSVLSIGTIRTFLDQTLLPTVKALEDSLAGVSDKA